MEKYTKIHRIGKGSFGVVYLVQRALDKKSFAMKTIELIGEKERKDAQNEAKILEKLAHPNIVNCTETFVQDDHLCLIMEYCEKGDLQHKIKEVKRHGLYLAEEQIMEWFAQLCLAIRYLHDHKIMHRDIKVQNTFLTSAGLIKLGDFGISKQLENTEDLAKTQTGTPLYLAPEMWNSISTFKSDIWMLGCLLHELCSLEKPFPGEVITNVMSKVLKEKHAPIPEHYSPFIHNLIDSLLEKDYEKRPTIQQICDRPEMIDEISKLEAKFPKVYTNILPKVNELSKKLKAIPKADMSIRISFDQYRIQKKGDDTPKEEAKTESSLTTTPKNDFVSGFQTPTTNKLEDVKPLSSVVSPKEFSKPPLSDQNSQKKKTSKPNSINAIIQQKQQKKANLSPSSQAEYNLPFTISQNNTPINNANKSSNAIPMNEKPVIPQQQSPLIRPVRVNYEEIENNLAEVSSKKFSKRLELSGKPVENYKKFNNLSINIPGPNSENSEHPNSKGDNKISSRKSPMDGNDPNTIPTTKTVSQKKFSFSDHVFDHRSPASPNRSFWVSQFVKERLGEEKYQKVKDLLESSSNPMQILKEQPHLVLDIIGESNADCLVMLNFLISHSSNSVTPTGTTQDNKIFKHFDKNFKSPLSSQRIMKHTFPVGDSIDDHNKSILRLTPQQIRSSEAKIPNILTHDHKEDHQN